MDFLCKKITFPETDNDPGILALRSATVRCLFISVVTTEVGCSCKLHPHAAKGSSTFPPDLTYQTRCVG